jgi:Recombination endonuclease VII
MKTLEEKRKYQREYMREYHRKHPDKNLANVYQWREKNPEKRKAQRKRVYERHKAFLVSSPAAAEKGRAERFRRNLMKYGVTLERYEAMLLGQGGLCAICKGLPGHFRLSVDHCHKTGEVRALLCSGCNTSLHMMERDLDWGIAAREYLEKFGRPHGQ